MAAYLHGEDIQGSNMPVAGVYAMQQLTCNAGTRKLAACKLCPVENFCTGRKCKLAAAQYLEDMHYAR
jgi:hypothetical protein